MILDPRRIYVADDSDDDGEFLLFHVSDIGVTDKLGYVYAEWADDLQQALDGALRGLLTRETFLLMNDDATVTTLTRCNDCHFLFVDIDKHVAESVTVPAVE